MREKSEQQAVQGHSEDRRQFLRRAAVAGSCAAAAAAVPGVVTAVPEAERASPQDEKVSGYRETQHIRDYYRTLSA